MYPQWPPDISAEELRELADGVTTFALSHGILYLPKAASNGVFASKDTGMGSAIHAPISLFPSPFPRTHFELAQRLQRIYNVLYARIAMDEPFLDRLMESMVADDFIVRLWGIWKGLREEGVQQRLHLGLFRSDYLLHVQKGRDRAHKLSLKQVEFNTISSSFGPLSERTAAMHRHLYASTNYFDASPLLKPESFPANETTAGLVEGLAAAHRAYNSPGSQILFVVQPGERNIFDQQWLAYELFEKYSIRVVRQTLEELGDNIRLKSRNLFLRISSKHGSKTVVEISTVYFRAGYGPSDYTSDKTFEVRALLERSRAIKCPSIALQLAGSKKVQQVLTQPGVLERYLCDETRWGSETFGRAEVDEIRASWMGMWGLDEENGVQKARESASSLVLKPQREGGGNNIYKEAIPGFLGSLREEERPGWIAMKLIVTPERIGNYLLRAENGRGRAVKAEVVSELGIFGWALFGSGEEMEEKEAGWLLRTKTRESDEGGVAAGYSVLDSLVLVDEDFF